MFMPRCKQGVFIEMRQIILPKLLGQLLQVIYCSYLYVRSYAMQEIEPAVYFSRKENHILISDQSFFIRLHHAVIACVVGRIFIERTFVSSQELKLIIRKLGHHHPPSFEML